MRWIINEPSEIKGFISMKKRWFIKRYMLKAVPSHWRIYQLPDGLYYIIDSKNLGWERLSTFTRPKIGPYETFEVAEIAYFLLNKQAETGVTYGK